MAGARGVAMAELIQPMAVDAAPPFLTFSQRHLHILLLGLGFATGMEFYAVCRGVRDQRDRLDATEHGRPLCSGRACGSGALGLATRASSIGIDVAAARLRTGALKTAAVITPTPAGRMLIDICSLLEPAAPEGPIVSRDQVVGIGI